MGLRDAQELLPAFRKGDVKSPLTAQDAFAKELNGERRLAGTRVAVDKVEMVLRQAAVQDLIESDDSGGGSLDSGAGSRRGASLWLGQVSGSKVRVRSGSGVPFPVT